MAKRIKGRISHAYWTSCARIIFLLDFRVKYVCNLQNSIKTDENSYLELLFGLYFMCLGCHECFAKVPFNRHPNWCRDIFPEKWNPLLVFQNSLNTRKNPVNNVAIVVIFPPRIVLLIKCYWCHSLHFCQHVLFMCEYCYCFWVESISTTNMAACHLVVTLALLTTIYCTKYEDKAKVIQIKQLFRVHSKCRYQLCRNIAPEQLILGG